VPTGQPLGLRERKKLDTRMALSVAALELAFERGLEHVSREDIAARAGVSARTFNNYFANKYEAVVYRQIERMQRAVAVLRSRPADEPIWTAVTAAVLAPLETDGGQLDPPTHAQLVETVKLINMPEMQTALERAVLGDMLAAVVSRTGADPDRDLYPRLVTGAILAAYRACGEIYVRADPPVPITTLLRRAFADLARGLPGPTTG
jgi:AcrR family transcriptional regulator